MSGYTLSYRDKWTNPVFRNLLEAAIWSWMCDAAAWKETRVRFSGKLISLKRGQLVTSERFISEGFGIGRQVVRTFLDNLQNDQMITREITHSSTIITICNYDKYQPNENAANPETNHQQDQIENHNQPTHNPNKNEGNEYKEDINKQTQGRVRGSEKPKLEDLTFEHMEPWLQQQETRGSPITIDVRGELERFKTHFLSYGGKDKNGNAISDWVAKFGHWLLEQQARVKNEVKQNAKNIGHHQSGKLQNPEVPSAGRSKFDIETDRIKAQIIADFEAKREAETQGLPTVPDSVN